MENIDLTLKKWGQSLESSILGQEEAIQLSLITLIAGGHLLLEGPPGVGKTSLAHRIAESIRGEFRRIQMTSDLLPSDILGNLRMRPGGQDLEFRKGPIFTNVMLADELNRTSAKTQSALLEAMAEGRVSIDGKTYDLPNPFFVIATQNPQEFQGVFPLTESQLDRFLMHVELNIPEKVSELALLKRHAENAPTQTVTTSIDLPAFLTLRELAKKVFIEETVLNYAQKVVADIRTMEGLYYGASVRATLQLLDAAKAKALLHHRDYVTPDDIKTLGPHIFAHRLSFRGLEQRTSDKKEKIRDVLDKISLPK